MRHWPNAASRPTDARRRWQRRIRDAAAATSVLASLASAHTDPIRESWRWTRFGVESGLPSDAVDAVVVANDGTPWALDREGIARFDGYAWHRVHAERWSPHSNTGYRMEPYGERGILVTSGGRLYAGDASGLRHVPVTVDRDTLAVHIAIPASDGSVFLQSDDGLHRLQNGRVEPLPWPMGLRRTPAGRLVADAGAPWFVTRDGVYEWTGNRWQERFGSGVAHVAGNGSEGVLAVNLALERNGVWTWTGAAPPERLAGQTGSIVVALDMNASGDVIVVHQNGLVRRRQAGLWSTFASAPAPLEEARFVFLEDDGDLWVSTNQGVFSHRAHRRWTQVSVGPSDRDNCVNAILRRGNGDIWLATGDGVAMLRASGEIDRVTRIGEVHVGVVTGLAEDREGGVWMSSGADFDGAYRWQDGTWTHVGPEDGLGAERIHRIVPDRGGNLWFLGVGKVFGESPEPGAYMYDGRAFHHWSTREGLLHDRVYAFAEAPDGTRWFGTLKGISRWRDGEWRHWHDPDRVGLGIYEIALDAEGRPWFGHHDRPFGLGTIDAEGRVRHFTVADGLVDNRVWDVAFGLDRTLWIATAAGLASYRDGSFATFDRQSGNPASRLWPLSIASDRVYAGSLGNGLISLALAESDNPPPRITITETWSADEGVFARWRVEAFEAEMPAEEIETRHRWDGGSWSPWSTQREASAADLESGGHVLDVQSKSLFGDLSEPARVQVVIAPPWYLRPGLLIGGSLWLAAVVGGATYTLRRARRHRRQLHESERRYRSLADNTPGLMFAHTFDGVITALNPAAARHLGYASDEIIGRSLRDVLDSRSDPSLEDYLARIRTREHDQGSLRVRTRTGQERIWQYRNVRLDDPEVGPSVVGHALDVTELSHADDERRRLESQLRQSQKMEAIGLLAGGVAHDFNNLLTVIGGHADLIASAPHETGSVRESAEQILRAQERAGALTRQLLAFGRGQILQPRVLPLNAVIEGIESLLRRLIGADIALSFVLAHDAGRVRVDPGQIEQVVVNLVINARDALPDGGEVRVTTSSVVLGSRATGGLGLEPGAYAVIEVHDDGIGMDPDTLRHVFDPFFTTKESGTGLGLSTAHGIIEQSGGRIQVRSVAGAGSTFSVYLPQVTAPGEASAHPPVPSSAAQGNETILLAEDDEPVRTLISRGLRSYGYAVITAANGVEAAALAADGDVAFDLLLTDVVMPEMNGPELAERVRVSRPGVAVVYMSGYVGRDIARRYLDDSTVTIVEKPFSLASLVDVLRKTLDRAASAAADVRR